MLVVEDQFELFHCGLIKTMVEERQKLANNQSSTTPTSTTTTTSSTNRPFNTPKSISTKRSSLKPLRNSTSKNSNETSEHDDEDGDGDDDDETTKMDVIEIDEDELDDGDENDDLVEFLLPLETAFSFSNNSNQTNFTNFTNFSLSSTYSPFSSSSSSSITKLNFTNDKIINRYRKKPDACYNYFPNEKDFLPCASKARSHKCVISTTTTKFVVIGMLTIACFFSLVI
jgi:hypothetical protein